MRPHFIGKGICNVGGLSVGHFYNGNSLKRELKMIFKGSWCVLFPGAVVTLTVKESVRSTDPGSLQVLALS